MQDIIITVESMATHIWGAKCSQKLQGAVAKEVSNWKPSRHSWIKVNSDDAAGRDKDWLAMGGILRDSNRCWILRYEKVRRERVDFEREIMGYSSWKVNCKATRVHQCRCRKRLFNGY